MKRHQQIRKEQASLREKLERRDIKVEDFVSEMRILNEELKIVEQKMYNEHDTCILSLDTKINLLQKENLLLNNKIGLLNISKENQKKINVKLIKKDKYIHKLKKSIKNDYLNFNEEMLPKSYLRISKRFPHLSLPEIIDFEKRVRENGGSVQVHKGYFRLLNRACLNSGSGVGGCRPSPIDVFMGWDCCPGRILTGCCKNYAGHLTNDGRTAIWNKSGDFNNKNPNSNCCQSVTFYLKEEDEKKQDISQVKVSYITTSISHNIKILEKTIEEYSEKIEKLKGLQENVYLLIDT
jgi:hypothetical protein